MTHESVKTIEVAAAILEKEGRFLITKRLKHSHLGHLWEFPGGKLEPGESLEECIVRECHEEINVWVQPVRKVKELRHDYPEVKIHLHFFLCTLLSGIPQAIHCEEWRWVKPQELTCFEFPEADREIVLELIAEHEVL